MVKRLQKQKHCSKSNFSNLDQMVLVHVENNVADSYRVLYSQQTVQDIRNIDLQNSVQESV